MLRPKIVIKANNDDYELFFKSFRQNAPKNLAGTFDDGVNLAAQLDPEYVPRDKNLSLDEITQAPHALLYVFSCASRQIYVSKFQQEIRSWLRQNTKLYIHPLVVFINDPKITKSKNIFSGFNSFYQLLNEEIPKLMTVLYSSEGIPKEEMAKVWAAVTDEIRNSYQDRINFLKDNIRQIDSVDTIRTYVNLSLLYQQATLYNRTIEFSQMSFEVIQNSPKFFKSFFSDKSFSYPFDFTTQIEDYEKAIVESMAGHYDILYVLFKREIQNLKHLRRTDSCVKKALDFLVYINGCANSGDAFYNAPEPAFHYWLCQALTNIIAVCKSDEGGELSKFMISTTNWYLRELETLFNIVKSSEKTKVSNSFLVISRIVESQDSYIKEVISKLTTLINVANNLALFRIQALACFELLKLTKDKMQLFQTAISTFVKYGYYNLLPDITKEQMSELPKGLQLNCAFNFLAAKATKYYDLAFSILEENLTGYKGPTIYLNTSLPIKISLDYKPFTIGKYGKIKAKINWDFPGKLPVELFCIGFDNVRHDHHMENKIVYNWFTCKEAVLYDGAKLRLTGAFHEAFNTPQVVGFRSKDLQIIISFPPNDIILIANPSPKDVELAIDMPEYLLPNRTQHAQIIVTANATIPNLALTVSGLISHTARLRLQDGGMIEPTTGLTFENVPVGRHTMILPILAQHSGTLHVEANGVKASADFTVMDILELKVIYNPETKSAELISSLQAHSEVKIIEVSFVGKENQAIECKPFGVPFTVEENSSYAVFLLESEPQTANVLVQHGILKPFILSIDCETIGEGESVVKEQITPPITPFVPVDFKLALQSTGYSENDNN